jgi:hypothetical protein
VGSGLLVWDVFTGMVSGTVFADFVLNLDGDRYYIVAFGILFEL